MSEAEKFSMPTEVCVLVFVTFNDNFSKIYYIVAYAVQANAKGAVRLRCTTNGG